MQYLPYESFRHLYKQTAEVFFENFSWNTEDLEINSHFLITEYLGKYYKSSITYYHWLDEVVTEHIN